MDTTKDYTIEELSADTHRYVNTSFNYIELSVVEKMSDNMLIEKIRPLETTEETLQEVFNDLSTAEKVVLIQNYIKINWFEFDFKSDMVSEAFALYVMDDNSDMDDIECLIMDTLPSGSISGDSLEDQLKEDYSNEIEDKTQGNQDENYPMWNTLFEFRSQPSEKELQAAIDAGFGVAEDVDGFNTLLFASGCGYSFYGAHWIPMFLDLPWNEDKQGLFTPSDYQML